MNTGWRGRYGQRVGWLVGVLLLAGAGVWTVWGLDWPEEAVIRPGLAAAVAGLVGLNLALAALLWWWLTRSFDAVPGVTLTRMAGLVAASELLNYLPFRAGLVGRVTFLRVRHGLPLRQSIAMIVYVLALSVAVVGLTLVALMLLGGSWAWYAMAGLMVALIAGIGPVSRLLLLRPVRCAWLLVLLRVGDLLIHGLRLQLAVALVGHAIDYREAVMLSAAGVLVRLTGLTPNGLGLREWVMALAASLASPVILAATLVERAVELGVTVLAGLLGLPLLLDKEPEGGREGEALAEPAGAGGARESAGVSDPQTPGIGGDGPPPPRR